MHIKEYLIGRHYERGLYLYINNFNSLRNYKDFWKTIINLISFGFISTATVIDESFSISMYFNPSMGLRDTLK